MNDAPMATAKIACSFFSSVRMKKAVMRPVMLPMLTTM